MSHNSQENTGYFKIFDKPIVRYFVLLGAFFCLFYANLSVAAINPGTKTERNPIRVLKSTLSGLSDRNQAVLDWQTQEFELVFDLPADGWYENLDLFLTAIPEGNVSRTDPITISYNGEKPISLYGQASRFDAHIKLDPARIRTSRNSLKIRYKTPHKHDCLAPEHGKWILDLRRSKLATKTRSKSRDLQITEFKQRINHPMTAPKRVAIRAFGKNKAGLEALVAQGIASRMDTLPEFQFTTGNADLEVLIGEQGEISKFVSDKKMLEANVAQAFTDSGTRPKLVLTAHTKEDVLALARGFAAHQFPDVRRRHISLNEFYASPTFNRNAVLSAGKYKIADIGDTTISPSLNPAPAELDFNIVDPDSSHGKLTLNIVKSPLVDPKSRLKVRLNNQSIGYTMLDKKQKIVSFDIKPGMFRSAANKITIEPILATPHSGFTCSSASDVPGLLVSNRSKLEIKTTKGKLQNNLNQFAASGAPFFNTPESQTAIILTARSSAERASSLQFLGHAVQQFGPQFANAEYLTELPPINDRAKNLFIIGPNAFQEDALLAAAPSAMRLAMRGKPTTGPNTLTIASVERHASINEAFAIQRLAQSYSKNTRIQSGGIASMFASPFSDKHMIGVFTSNRASKYSTSVDALTQPGFWNGLQGSVARWSDDTIIMAQTPGDLPNSYVAQSPKISFQASFARKWTDMVGGLKSMWAKPRPTEITAPETESLKITEPVSGDTSAASLRGDTNSLEPSKSKTAGTSMLQSIAAKIQNAYASEQKSAISIRDKDANMIAVRTWVNKQAHSRNTLMALIIISILLLIGMATPKVDR